MTVVLDKKLEPSIYHVKIYLSVARILRVKQIFLSGYILRIISTDPTRSTLWIQQRSIFQYPLNS